MALSSPFLAALLFTSVVIGQNVSSTSQTTCLTKLGTSSVAPIPTITNLRSLTINTIQRSTYTPTATSTPPDTTTTLTYTVFPTTTTTVFNSEVDTFSTTTTIITEQLSTATVVVTITQTNTQYSTVQVTTTVPTPPLFIPAQTQQARQTVPYKNKKRGLVGPLARIAARQTASSSAASASVPATEYVYTEAVSCTGVVEYYSIKTSVVATGPASTKTLPVITDTTSTTLTTTITSSVLQTPASTTLTISSTITTTSLAGTFTSTATATTSTVSTVQGPEVTAYAACQPNNFISTDRDGRPIHALAGPLTSPGVYASPEAVLSGSSSYACCVACETTFSKTCGGSAFNTQNGQCLIYDGTKPTSGKPFYGCYAFVMNLGYFASNYKNSYSGPYIVSSGPCGTVFDQDPSF